MLPGNSPAAIKDRASIYMNAIQHSLLRALLIAAIIVAVHRPASSHPLPGDGQNVAGWAENVRLYADAVAITVPAKLDTGAQSTSINAADQRRFVKGNLEWVAFSLVGGKGNKVEITAPIKRIARIRRAEVEVAERPVIELGLCIAGYTATVEVTLADRSGMDFSVLVGRNFMADRLLVDSGRSFIASNSCGDAAQR